jgi:hypothetical protein
MMHPMQHDQPGCIKSQPGRNMQSPSTTESDGASWRLMQPAADIAGHGAARRSGTPGGPQSHTLRRRQRVFTRTAE